MSRKPFEALREVKYPEDAHDDGFNVAIEKANAAITQDHAEYKALRDTLCITERDLDRAINDRDAIKDERDALREENERLKAQVGAEQLDADRVRTASRELEVEVERLKERLEKSEARRTHWDAVTLTNYEFTKTQLAEAVTQIHELMNSHFNLYKSTFGEDRDPNDDLVRIKARDFLVKAKS